MTKNIEKLLTPISIIVAGIAIGAGIWLSNASPSVKSTTSETGSANLTTAESFTKLSVVKDLKIKPKDLLSCIENEDTKTKVDNDLQLAYGAGLQGTPHMIVMMKNGDQFPLMGALPKEYIEQAITEGKPIAEQADMLPENVAIQVITEADHITGNPETALATIVEYADFNCVYCKQLHPTLKSLVDEGKIAWVYRQAPVLGENSRLKAIASECAAKLSNSAGFQAFADELVKQ